MEYFDKFHYFKLTAFMIQVCRLRAYEEYAIEKKRIYEEEKAKYVQENLFLTGSKQKKPKMPNVPFNIHIGMVGASLQLSNFEYLYATLYGEVIKNKGSELKLKEFHAALQLLTQFLYIIRDMASSANEKNKKNAMIL